MVPWYTDGMTIEPEPAGLSPGAGGPADLPEFPQIARFLHDPEPCSYLPGRESRTEVRLAGTIDPDTYARLLGAGVRRFGMVLFRPACEGCRLCVPIRVPIARFRPSRSQARVLRRNRDVSVEIGPPRVDDERIALHRAFHADRTARLGWPAQQIAEEEYSRIFVENIVPTMELGFRLGGRLVGVAYADVTASTLNSIYGFHDPALGRRSLGTFDVLAEIALGRRMGREHLYLGFWVAGCRSMEYKARFRPAEVLVDGTWRDLAEMEGAPRGGTSGEEAREMGAGGS